MLLLLLLLPKSDHSSVLVDHFPLAAWRLFVLLQPKMLLLLVARLGLPFDCARLDYFLAFVALGDFAHPIQEAVA